MNRIFGEIGKIRGIRWILSAAAAGLALLLIGTLYRGAPPAEEEQQKEFYAVGFYTENLEERIARLCREVAGVKEAYVLLTLEGGSEYIYAENESGSARDYVILRKSDDESALPVQEISPRIRGVAVVCTRGDDSAVRLTITELLCAALGIPASAVRVAGT